jgi:class 3 adenylate cyclase
MGALTQRYQWTHDLAGPAAALWPAVSDTDRFNRDCGLPAFEKQGPSPGSGPGVKRMRARYLGFFGEWDEEPFEWIEPQRFSVRRRFIHGPVRRIDQSCTLEPSPTGGTRLTYEVVVEARNPVGALLALYGVGWRLRRAVRALGSLPAPQGPAEAHRRLSPSPNTTSRAEALALASGQPRGDALRLVTHLVSADEQDAARIRPLALARAWGADGGRTLDLFLHATRQGLTNLRWEIICPHCRGSDAALDSLGDVGSEGRCTSCGVDFDVNFDRSVEVTFAAHPAVRRVERRRHCVGGPQTTPHIVAQASTGPDGALSWTAAEAGAYRARALGSGVIHPFRVAPEGLDAIRLDYGAPPPPGEPVVRPGGAVAVWNASESPRTLVVERAAWVDDAATAALVGTRQAFRDLFARELLRPGERIGVQSLAFLFTDLKDSTAMYRREGDAVAFGRVLGHFDILRQAIVREEGAIVKTMGDAVMAVFIEPAAALRAAAHAQAELARRDRPGGPLGLKCSVHCGPCLAIRQNDRLDYFGTTVNTAARLCSVSRGSDIVTTDAVLGNFSAASLAEGRAGPDRAVLRGLGSEPTAFWRVSGLVF